MGDQPPEIGSAPSSPVEEWTIEGTGGAPGIAIGTAFRYDASVPEVGRETIPDDEAEAELEHLSEAIERAEQELETVRFLAHEALEADSEAIIEAQSMMLKDDQLLQSIRERIRKEHASAGAAVKSVLKGHQERLQESGDSYFRDRVGDLVDLEKRLLRALHHGKVATRIGDHSIVIAPSLTATDVLWFSRRGMRGCATIQGGVTSHVSIIAKALGLPTIFGIGENSTEVSNGTPVILDGDGGRLVVHPTEETLEAYKRHRSERKGQAVSPSASTDRPTRTADGHVVPLRANVDSESDLDLLEVCGAEGIGLLRTEMLYLATEGGLRSENAQIELYQRAAEASGDEGATIRLLDLGGDKPLPLGLNEENPALGWRGIRVLLDQSDELLRPQLRALLRANTNGVLRVLLPMVTHLDEVRRVRTVLGEEVERLTAQEVPHDPDLPLGIMVEVPAVALQAEKFAEEVDFFSVGTNDLTQYVLAVDRGNERVLSRFDALHPAVLRLIRQTVEAGAAADCPVEVCGESAGDVLAAPVLLGLGVDALSASPRSLPAVRQVLQSSTLENARALADEALAAPDAETVRRYTQEWFEVHVSTEGGPAPISDMAQHEPPETHS